MAQICGGLISCLVKLVSEICELLVNGAHRCTMKSPFPVPALIYLYSLVSFNCHSQLTCASLSLYLMGIHI